MEITAIIPTYKRPQQSLRALESVLCQTYPCKEVLFIDDASGDETVSTLTHYINKNNLDHVKIIEHSANSGVSAARNTGIRNANCNWLAFLDSDDEWLPEKLNMQKKSLEQSGLLFSHTDEFWKRNNKEVKKKSKHKKHGGFVFADCIKMCFIGPSTSLMHKILFNKIGLFDENMRLCEDYDLWLRLSSQFEIGYVDQKLIIKHGGHADQLSLSKSLDFYRLYALSKHFKSSILTKGQQDLVNKAFFDKAKIFKAGCIKHNNMELLKKTEELEKKVFNGS